MAIDSTKCSSIGARPARKTWTLTFPEIVHKGIIIPLMSGKEVNRYLGVHITSWAGIQAATSIDEIKKALARLLRTRLKASQKIVLWSQYMLPHFMYGLINESDPPTKIRELDHHLKKTYKSILHLPQPAPNAALFSSNRDGGLGLPITADSALRGRRERGGGRFHHRLDYSAGVNNWHKIWALNGLPLARSYNIMQQQQGLNIKKSGRVLNITGWEVPPSRTALSATAGYHSI